MCREVLDTTFRTDLLFIVAEEAAGVLWFVVYEGREADSQLEQRQPVFRTGCNFWEVREHEWQTNQAVSRMSYDAKWVEPQWQASGWTVCTRHDV